jgi:glycosyltransferase involved in cell wall biosynthesis
MPVLIVVVPTRGRPAAAAELIAACNETCTAQTRLWLVVDADDPALGEYRDVVVGEPIASVRVVPADPGGHVAAINHAARYAAQMAPVVGKLDDDHRPKSMAWDKAYLEALDQLGVGIAYGNDLLRGDTHPTAPAMSSAIIATLGHMAPPVLRHLYCDDYWRDLGRAAGCLRYLPDVIVEHLHPAAGKADWDEGHRRVNEPAAYRRDGDAYSRYLAGGQLLQDAEKVRALR